MTDKEFWMQVYIASINGAGQITDKKEFLFNKRYYVLDLETLHLYAESIANKSLETLRNTFEK